MAGSGATNGMIRFRDHLIYARGSGLYATRDGVSHLSLGTVTDGKKLFLPMGDKLFIYPDKLYLVYDEGFLLRSLEIKTAVMKNCVFTGNKVTLPDGQTWTSLGFEVGDCVRVINADDVNPTPEGNHRIASLVGRTATVVQSFPGSYESHARFARSVPSLEHGCVTGGRIFGTVGSTIYVSARGSGTDFYSPDTGSGVDPAILATGDDNPLTACAPWQGYVIFFTADRILRLLGSRPDSFALSDGGGVGLPADMADTLCEVDGGLYFLNGGGVYRYRGQEATRISSVGESSCTDGVGGTDGVCYYLGVTRQGTRELWVYSPERDSWYAEDDVAVTCMFRYEGMVWMQSGDGYVWIASSEGRSASTAMREELIYGMLTGELITQTFAAPFPRQCRPMEAVVRASRSMGGTLEVYASYDGGEEVLVGRYDGRGEQTFRMPLPIGTVYGVTLRLVMQGEWVVRAVACGFAP